MKDRSVLVAMIDPAGRGGLYAMAVEFRGMLERMGKRVSFLYPSAVAEDQLSPRNLIRRGRLWDTRMQQRRGLDGMAVGHLLAHFQPFVYFWPFYPAVRRCVKEFDMRVVLGGAIVGFTIAWMGKPYICWLSTLHEDEQRAKAETGDQSSVKYMASLAFRLRRWQERFVLRRARLIAAISDHTAQRVRTVYPETADKVVVVTVPVDIETFRPVHRSASPSRVSGKIAIWVGRVEDPRKNVRLALSAFQKVLVQMPEARLIIVGARSTSLSALVAELGMKESVEFQSSVTTASEMAALYRRADVFVLSSRQEGLGIVVAEAMACGLPVVSTRSGGPEAYVSDGESGYLVDKDDHGGLADALLRILTDDSLRRSMGVQAVSVAQRHFSRPAVQAQFLRAFESVESGPVGGS